MEDVNFPIENGDYSILGGGNSNIFGSFAPIPGEMIQFDEHIFQIFSNGLKPPTGCFQK